MGGFSALCLFEAGAITAVSGPYLYTDTEQTHGDTTGPCVSVCAYFLVWRAREKERAYHVTLKEDVCLCTMHSKNKLR